MFENIGNCQYRFVNMLCVLYMNFLWKSFSYMDSDFTEIYFVCVCVCVCVCGGGGGGGGNWQQVCLGFEALA